MPPGRDPEQRNPWGFVPLRLTHPTIARCSHTLHVPLGPVVNFGLGSPGLSLGSFHVGCKFLLISLVVAAR